MIWKTVDEFPLYEVSDEGQVRKTVDGVILSGGMIDGYRRVNLTNKDLYPKPKNKRVHILVALAFIPNPDPVRLTQVNHKDTNRLNNHVSNLEWITNKDNNKTENKTKKRVRPPFTKIEHFEILAAKGIIPDSKLAIKYKCGVKAIHGVWSGKNKKGKQWREEYLQTNPINKDQYKGKP